MLDVRLVRGYQVNYPHVMKSINKLFLYKAGVLVQGEAMLRSPIGDGRLAGSIKYKVNLANDNVTVGTNVEYAPYVEYGTGIHAEGGGGRKTPWSYFSDKYGWVTTKGMIAKPFMRPALDANRRKLREMWVSSFRKTFRAMGKL